MEDAPGNNGPPEMPPEMWNAVFVLLEPSDLRNAMRTCKEWEAVLESKKSVIYFQNVFLLLGNYLSLQSLLALRGTCKDLKTTVDMTLEYSIDRTKLAHFRDDWGCTKFFHPTLLLQLGKCYTFPDKVSEIATQSFKVNMFLEKMGAHSGNPFIGKSVRFQFADRKIEGQYPRYSHQSSGVAIQLLSRFGQHLTHFTHFVPCSHSNPVFFEAITDLPNILNKLPNLQSLFLDWKSEAHHQNQTNNQITSRAILDRHEPLTFDVMPPDEFDWGEDDQRDRFPQMRDDLLPLYLTNLSFPPMPNLTTLHYDFHDCYNFLPRHIGMSLLFWYGRQLTTFICNGDSIFFAFSKIMDVSILFQKLKHLRINDTGAITLRHLCKLDLPLLEQLQLSSSVELELDAVGLLKILDNFSNTLVSLILDIDLSSKLEDMDKVNSKQLPYLTHLSTRLCNLDRTVFWQVITPKCKAVEWLDLRITEEVEWHDVAVLQEQIQRAFCQLPKLQRLYLWIEGQHNPKNFVDRSSVFIDNKYSCNLSALFSNDD